MTVPAALIANGIGAFAIGLSAIGSQPILDPATTIISQYANSPTLTQLISNFAENIDPTPLFDDFYSLIWDVDTAQGYGLDVWGRIVGVNRVLQISAGSYLGFAEAGDPSVETPFNVAPFYTGQATTNNYALSDDAFRTLILAKAAANISNGSIPSINNILNTLFGSGGRCYVSDLGGMQMAYVFEFALDPVSYAIVAQSGVLPKPAGVATSIIQYSSVSDTTGGALEDATGYPINASLG